MTQKERKDLVLVDGKLVPAGEVPAVPPAPEGEVPAVPPLGPGGSALPADHPLHKALETPADEKAAEYADAMKKVTGMPEPKPLLIPFSEYGQVERQLITHEQPYKLEFHRSAKGDPHWVITIHAETLLKMLEETEEADAYLMHKYLPPAVVSEGEGDAAAAESTADGDKAE